MVITSIVLKGDIWGKVLESYSNFFKEQTYFDIFMLALSIGIIHDKRMTFSDNESDKEYTIPSTVIHNHNKGSLEEALKAAILGTNTEMLTEEQRIVIAFADDEETDFPKMKFLKEFANFGAIELSNLIGNSEVETMINNKNYFEHLRDADVATLRTEKMEDDFDILELE